MAVSRNSKNSRSFKKRPKSAATRGQLGVLAPMAVFIALAALSCAAVVWFYMRGYLVYDNDAQAHINTARRVIDSLTPGYEQLGTTWLPLPHVLMLPLVRYDKLWQTGLAGAIPSALFFVLCGTSLFAATRRLLGSVEAAVAATALLALNPNLLYMQSLAMTEAIYLGAFCGLFYFMVLFAQTQSLGAVTGAGLCSLAGCMTRYDGWFLIPFVALFFFIEARERKVLAAFVFGAIASSGCIYWLAHNYYFYSDALYFYRGEWSAKAIQARAHSTYPGQGDWALAFQYSRSAAQACAGPTLFWMGAAGILCAFIKRAWWAAILLLLPGVFYVMNIHSGDSPLFLPHLWYGSYYNTRYGLGMLPLFAFSAACFVAMVPVGARKIVATLAILAGVAPWIAYPRMENWICWKESQVNSETRRAWSHEAANYLRAHYRPGDSIFTSFSDLTNIYREAGIPFRATVNECNSLLWEVRLKRPDLFLEENWVISISGDAVSQAMAKAHFGRYSYRCVKMVEVKGAAPIEIFRRFNKPIS